MADLIRIIGEKIYYDREYVATINLGALLGSIHDFKKLLNNAINEDRYQEGYDAGEEFGYSKGLARCVSADKDEYNKGHEEGWDEGYGVGLGKGELIGYEKGYLFGYETGFSEGQAKAKKWEK